MSPGAGTLQGMESTLPITIQRGARRLRYTRTAKVLHWLLALLIVGNLALGLYMLIQVEAERQ